MALRNLSEAKNQSTMKQLGAMGRSSLVAEDRELGQHHPLLNPLAAACIFLNLDIQDPAILRQRYAHEKKIRGVWNAVNQYGGFPDNIGSLIVALCFENLEMDVSTSFIPLAQQNLKDPEGLITALRKTLKFGTANFTDDTICRISPYLNLGEVTSPKTPQKSNESAQKKAVASVAENFAKLAKSVHSACILGRATVLATAASREMRAKVRSLGVTEQNEKKILESASEALSMERVPRLEPTRSATCFLRKILANGVKPEGQSEASKRESSKEENKVTMGTLAAGELSLIEEADIEAMKVMAKPPADVEEVMMAVCVFLGRTENPSWVTARTVLGYYNDDIDDRPFLTKFRSVAPGDLCPRNAFMLRDMLFKIDPEGLNFSARNAKELKHIEPERGGHWEYVVRASTATYHLAKALQLALREMKNTVLKDSIAKVASALQLLPKAYTHLRDGAAFPASILRRMQTVKCIVNRPENPERREARKKESARSHRNRMPHTENGSGKLSVERKTTNNRMSSTIDRKRSPEMKRPNRKKRDFKRHKKEFQKTVPNLGKTKPRASKGHLKVPSRSGTRRKRAMILRRNRRHASLPKNLYGSQSAPALPAMKIELSRPGSSGSSLSSETHNSNPKSSLSRRGRKPHPRSKPDEKEPWRPTGEVEKPFSIPGVLGGGAARSDRVRRSRTNSTTFGKPGRIVESSGLFVKSKNTGLKSQLEDEEKFLMAQIICFKERLHKVRLRLEKMDTVETL